MKHYYYKKIRFTWAVIFAALALSLGQISYSADRTMDTTETLRNTVFNFNEIEPGFFRSGRLPEESYPELKKLGIKTVVNLIDKEKECCDELAGLKEYGIQTIRIPWNGFDRPKDEDVQKFIEVAKNPQNRPLLVHCKRGAERTGVMIACWRIAEKGWTFEQAHEEMKQMKFRWFWYGHLSDYVYEFAKRYGQAGEKSNNIWRDAKNQTLYFLYKTRKLVPFI